MMRLFTTLLLSVALVLPAFAEQVPTPPVQIDTQAQLFAVNAKEALPVEAVYDGIFPPAPENAAYVRLLTANVDAWFSRWYIIEHAKKTIDVTYFIVDKDVFGMSFLGLLKKKAAEGVKIRIMMDARGTKGFTRTFMGQDYLQELLEDPNIEIRVFNPMHSRLLAAISDIRYLISSDHDKIVLADGEWMTTGGRNISASYFVDPADVPTSYRDTCVLMYGKKVGSQIEMAFTEEFNRLNNETIRKDLFGDQKSRAGDLEFSYRAMQKFMNGGGLFKDTVPALKGILEITNKEIAQYKHMQGYATFRPFEGQRAYPCGIMDKNSFAGERNDITDNICKLIDACKFEVVIQNPYVIFTDKALAAIKRASARGVKVIIHTNSPVSTDSAMTQAFFLRDWKKTLAEIPNLRIYAFKAQRKLHSKTFVFDRAVAAVGTYNMDPMSEQINSEEVAAIKARPFGQMTALRIMNDIADSVEYKVEVQKDGTIKTIYGPEMHSPEKTIRILNLLGKLGFLKCLI